MFCLVSIVKYNNSHYYSVLYNNVVRPLYLRGGILFTCGKNLHARIISLIVEVWAHRTSLTPPF
jgi:hypothetical protein